MQESPLPFRDMLLEQQVWEGVSSALQKQEGSCLKAWPWTFLYQILNMQIYIRYRLEHFVSVNTHILTACWCTLPVAYTSRCPFLRPCWSWLPAGHSLCFSLRMVMDFFADAPALVLFYYFPQMASHFLVFFNVLSKEKNSLFYPCQKEYQLPSITRWHHLHVVLLVNDCGWYFSGLQESCSTGNCSNCHLYKPETYRGLCSP